MSDEIQVIGCDPDSHKWLLIDGKAPEDGQLCMCGEKEWKWAEQPTDLKQQVNNLPWPW